MITINIKEDASYNNLPVLKEILRGRDWKLKEITILYNPARGLPQEECPDKWPFKATFDANDEKLVIRVHSLTVGYRGTGPHDFASILDFFGIKYNEDHIYTKRLMDYDGYIRLCYQV